MYNIDDYYNQMAQQQGLASTLGLTSFPHGVQALPSPQPSPIEQKTPNKNLLLLEEEI